MSKIPAGLIIKQIIDEKKLKAGDVADKMGVSRQSVYQSYAKQVLSDQEVTKWSIALGVTQDEFNKRWQSTSKTDVGNSDYLLEHLTNLEDQFKRLLNQLDVKDRQIEKLMDLLGKLDPASDESKVKPLWDGKPAQEEEPVLAQA